MLEFILQYWMQILFGLIVSILGAGYAGLKRQISKYKNLELGLQCLLRSELIRMHDKYMERRLLIPFMRRMRWNGHTTVTMR